MKLQTYSTVGIWLGGMALAFAIGTAVGQQEPPTESKGVQTDPPVAIDLGPEIEGMQGRQLRIRKLAIEPGGIIGIHSHKDRPDVSYLVQGTLTEYRAGGYVKVRVGDTLNSSGKEVTHWLENKGTTQAVLIVADILRQP
jgi:quercetin dioxygenase-like cupin family protein